MVSKTYVTTTSAVGRLPPMLPASYGSPLETSPVLPEMGSWWDFSSPQMALAAALFKLAMDSMLTKSWMIMVTKMMLIGCFLEDVLGECNQDSDSDAAVLYIE